ncbi:protein of unknown function [Candidatus Promineifilum breve]|uniref:Uncharacterized protein n=1 Tax=Candidatus Promineifilum breve TaxID=1806508 RepID=A0A160SZV4_9CHLR|nr:protein of unknown function [Candidatus Promineifilum breve]
MHYEYQETNVRRQEQPEAKPERSPAGGDQEAQVDRIHRDHGLQAQLAGDRAARSGDAARSAIRRRQPAVGRRI